MVKHSYGFGVTVALIPSSSIGYRGDSKEGTPVTVVDPDLFRALLRRHAAAVVVVTARGTPPAGFTATSFTSVSLEPPMVSFCLAHTASSWPAVSRAGLIAVHVLTEHQEAVARTFATSGIDRFAAASRCSTVCWSGSSAG